MAHVHTFGAVAPAAAGIIQYVLLGISVAQPLSNRRPVITVLAQRLAMLQSAHDQRNLSRLF
jgi:hypothetical protein